MKDSVTTNEKELEPKILDVLNSWKKRCIDARDGHYKRAETLFDRAQLLGYILIYSTIFVTVFSFLSLNTSTVIFLGVTKQHVIVLIGCVAAVISGIVTQARYGERAEMHRSSGARYANISRDIEALTIKFNTGTLNNTDFSSQINNIITEWNNLSEDSLLTPRNETKPKLAFHALFALMFVIAFFIIAA